MIKELRIGNWIKHTNHEYLGEGYKNKVVQVDIDILHDLNGESLKDWYEPIPLTPEVLLAAGFGLSEFQNRMVITYENNKFDIWLYYYKEKCIYSSSCFPDGANPINYLHQLQNLYFALTGTELEIDITKLKQ